MDAKSFFNLVAELRKNQKDYFTTRSKDALSKSIELEKKVDAEIERVNRVLQEQNTK